MSVSAFPYGTVSLPPSGPSEIVTLSGSSGTPNITSDSALQPAAAETWWEFRTNGTVWKLPNGITTQFQDGSEWLDTQDSPSGDFWIKATIDSGDTPTLGNIGTWNQVAGGGAINRRWTWRVTVNFDSTLTGTLKIEISSASDGNPILDTGYYNGFARVFDTF